MSINATPNQQPDWADKASAGVVSFLKASPAALKLRLDSWRRSHDQDVLESALARIIETANGHLTSRTPKGSPVYIALREKADLKIDAFCLKWGVDRMVVDAEAPNLKELYALCIRERRSSAALKPVACFLACVISLFLIGAASGLIHAGHDWVMHLFSR